MLTFKTAYSEFANLQTALQTQNINFWNTFLFFFATDLMNLFKLVIEVLSFQRMQWCIKLKKNV
jgi:hypothetical protein